MSRTVHLPVPIALQGDLPLWYPAAGNGFPHLNLQWVSWVFNPLGILVSLIRPYDIFSLAIENAIWRTVGFAGAFVFARQWTNSALGATAIAATYVGSGVMSWAALSYSALIGQMFAPWILASGSLAIRATSTSQLARAAGTFGLASGLMIWCAYPGAWLTAPVLSGPVLVGLAFTRRGGMRRLLSATSLALVIALMLVSLILSETTSFTLIEGSIVYSRRTPEISEGLLRGIDLATLFLANPSYSAYISSALMHPLYSGILPPLLVLSTLRLSKRLASPLIACMLFAIALGLSNFQNFTLWNHPLFDNIAMIKSIESISDKLVLILVFVVPVGLTNAFWGRSLPVDAVDKVLLAGAGWVVVVSGDNPFANFLRFNVPPFVLVRYNHLYFWLVSLLISTFAWRRIDLISRWSPDHSTIPDAVRIWGHRLFVCGSSSLLISVLISTITESALGLGVVSHDIVDRGWGEWDEGLARYGTG